MSSTSLRRRVSYGALSAGLLAAGLIPLAASAAACASWTDPAGDATTGGSGAAPLADANLDIVSASFGTVGKDVVGVITTDGLSASSSDAGDEFAFRFTMGEADVLFYVDRTAPFGQEVDVTAGFYNFTTDGTGEATATFDVESKTVRLVGAVEQLAAAVGEPVAGKPVADLRAVTENQLLFGTLTPASYDTAEATVQPVIGTACTMAAAPPPAPSGSPSSGASPSAAASPQASASPAPSGSPEPSATAEPSAEPSPSPEPEPEPAVPVPAPGCFGFLDEEGDSDAAVGPAGSGDDPDLDLRSVTGRTTASTISGHLGVTELSSSPSLPMFTGHRFEFEFVAADKTVVLRATGTGDGTGLIDGTADDTLGVTAVFDEPSSQVVLSVDRAALAKALKTELPDGTVLTDLAARSFARTPATATEADAATSENPSRARYTVGDNACFSPRISVAAPAQVQTSDAAAVSVSLTTSDGRIAAGQTLTARVGSGRAVSATTDKHGAATLLVPVSVAAGTHDLVVRSTGEAGESVLRSPLRVLIERTVLGLRSSGSGTSRTVTATLTDDDSPRRALAGQRVVFSFGGRSVAATTDGAGRAVAQVPAGSAVEASFAGRSGFLAPAKARGTA